MEAFARTLYEYKDILNWVRQLGWTDEDLKMVPVHEQATAGEDYLNLENMGGTALGVTVRAHGGPTSVKVGDIKNLYVYKREVPPRLYKILDDILERGGTSGYQESGIFGERGEREDFPPK